jgi:hypothetical protein
MERKELDKDGCRKILSKLIRHRYAWPFLMPVDAYALGIMDYPLVIQHPMDFGTIKANLDKNDEYTIEKFVADVNLVFSNACTYNGPNSDLSIMASTLSELFHQHLKRYGFQEAQEAHAPKALETFSGDLNPQISSTDQVNQTSSDNCTNEHYIKSLSDKLGDVHTKLDALQLQLANAKQPTKKSQEIDTSISPSMEEKRNLSAAISSLPHNKLSQVVEILSRSENQLFHNQSEIEICIDLDHVDVKTFRELQSFAARVSAHSEPPLVTSDKKRKRN